MMGDSLYISLSNGWSWIKCHLLIKMFLRLCKAGWYVVTKDNFLSHFIVLLSSLLPFGKFNLRGDFFYEILRVTSSAKAFFEVVDVFIDGFSWGVSSQKSKDFALYETFTNPVRVTGREMRVLKVSVGLKCVRMSRIPWLWNLLSRYWLETKTSFSFFFGPLRSSTFAQNHC